MYLGYQNGKIKFYTEKPLDKELYRLDKIEETQDEYVLDGDEYVPKDDEWEEKQKEEKRARDIAEIKNILNELDLKSVRALRAIASGDYTEDDSKQLNEIETAVKKAREDLAELINEQEATYELN